MKDHQPIGWEDVALVIGCLLIVGALVYIGTVGV